MCSRKLLISVLLILLFGLSSVTLAVPQVPQTTAAESGTATNNSSSVKTDYHVKITNNGNMWFVPAKPGALKTKGNLGITPPGGSINYVGEPTVQGNGTMELIIEWKNLTINHGDTIAWGVIINCCNNQVEVKEEWFTPREPTIDWPIPALGFEVKRNGEFYLTNNTEFPITFANLLVSIGNEPFDIEKMIDRVTKIPGTGPGISGTVDNGGELFIGRYDELLPGMFLRGSMLTSVATTDGTPNTSRRILGHEHPPEIPTVSEWGLIVMTGLVLAAGTMVIIWRKRRLAV